MRTHRVAFLLGGLLFASTPGFSQSLTTIFAGGNSGTTTWTNQFDLTVLNPLGATITAFDVNCENTRSGGVGSPFTVTVWITAVGSTYLGNQTNPSAWTQISQGAGVSRAQGSPTSVDVADFTLAPGTYGVALEYNGTAMAYTNGNGSNQSYANADIQIDLGSSTTGLFGSPVYDPRVWNGTIHYFVAPPTWREQSVGCAGSNGVPTLAPAPGSRAQIGTNFTLEVTNLPLPTTAVSLSIGLSSTTWSGLNLPFDLGALGAPSCSVHVSRETDIPGTGTMGTASFVLPIPSATFLLGRNAYFQALVLDPGANALNVTASNGGDAYVGS